VLFDDAEVLIHEDHVLRSSEGQGSV